MLVKFNPQRLKKSTPSGIIDGLSTLPNSLVFDGSQYHLLLSLRCYKLTCYAWALAGTRRFRRHVHRAKHRDTYFRGVINLAISRISWDFRVTNPDVCYIAKLS